MLFPGPSTAINSPDDFLPLRIFVGILTTLGLALILLLPVLFLEWATDRILFWRRPRLIREAAPLLGAEAVTHFPGAQELGSAFRGESSLMGLTRNVLRFSPSRYVFDYEWFDDRLKGTRRGVHTVAAFEMRRGLPRLHLRPHRSLFARLGEFHLWSLLLPAELRPCRVQFASGSEFSRRYMVMSVTADAEAVKEFFTPGVLNFFEQLDARPKWRVDARYGWLFVRSAGTVFGRRLPFRRHYLVAPGKLPIFLEQASAIAQQLEFSL